MSEEKLYDGADLNIRERVSKKQQRLPTLFLRSLACKRLHFEKRSEGKCELEKILCL